MNISLIIIIISILASINSASSKSKKAKDERAKRLSKGDVVIAKNKQNTAKQTKKPKAENKDIFTSAKEMMDKEFNKAKNVTTKQKSSKPKQVKKQVVVNTVVEDIHHVPKPVKANVKVDIKPNKTLLQMEHEKVAISNKESSIDMDFSGNDLVKGIIWAEVLAKPKAYSKR